MNKRQIFFTAILSTIFTLTLIATVLLVSGSVVAAPLAQATPTVTPTPVPVKTYVGVSSMAFMPVDSATRYQKDVLRQVLTLASDASKNGTFVAALMLPDKSVLTGLTVFGEDFDNQGAVTLRLKRCDHGQARCATLAETTSTATYAAGQFETLKVTIPNEVVDNFFYSYFLELELTPQSSGLRAVRLELLEAASLPSGDAQPWALTDNITNFLIPNQGLAQARICTDDLSHLPNATHYPTVDVDGQDIPLASNECITVWGYTIQIRRELNSGPSTGTYLFLQ